MKRMLCTVLCAAMLLCGCQSAPAADGETQGTTEDLTEEVTENVTDPQPVVTEPQTPTQPFVEQGTESGAAIGGTGLVRVAYNGNVSSVRYITSRDQLPVNDALSAYDESYFETKALVVVLESVSSGSVKVGIESIENGVVTLSHELSGDVGTADMATWLLWAEVDQGFDYQWSVANPALKPNTSAY